jgi:hypothetical protein
LISARRSALLLVVGAAAISPAASAHGEADLLHGMLDGAVLFFTALEFLLPVLMVALLARRHRLRPVMIQAAALGTGLLVALLGLPVPGDPSAVGLYARGYLVALGLLVLFNLRLPEGLVLVLVLATGALTGTEAGHAVSVDLATGFAPAVGLLSSAICFFVPAALIASIYPEGWQRIAMRVVASWIAAIAVIDIAFTIVGSG